MFAVSRIRLNFWVWVFCRSSSCKVFFSIFFVCRSFIEGIEFGVAKVFATRQPASALATILLFASQPGSQTEKNCYNCANSEVFFVFRGSHVSLECVLVNGTVAEAPGPICDPPLTQVTKLGQVRVYGCVCVCVCRNITVSDLEGA